MIPLAALSGAGVGLGIALLVVALRDSEARPAFRRVRVSPGMARRGALATVVGLSVGVVVRWPVAAVSAAGFVLSWPRLFGGSSRNNDEVARVEAIAG